MLTLRRIYLYAVLGVALAVLLLGLTDIVRIALDRIADTLAARTFISDDIRAELSWALALVIVSAPVFVVHLVLVRRSLTGPAAAVADERACASRSTYFFLVLLVTGVLAWMRLFELADAAIHVAVSGARAWEISGVAAGALIAGGAWVLHAIARRHDFAAAPSRTAGDWLTRGYLYGTLFATAMLVCIGVGNTLATVARRALDLQPTWESGTWWYEEIATFAALAGVSLAAWAIHWLMAGRLLRAAAPMGAAHRDSRTRTGYFLAVVLAAAAATVLLVSMGLREVLAGLTGTWSSSDGSRFVEDVGGPLLLAGPFLVAWWWHLRRATAEAQAFQGTERALATRRAGRLVVALVGLAGLAIGLTWELQALLDAFGSAGQPTLFSSDDVSRVSTSALAGALVGLLVWAPAWTLSQQERRRDPQGSATAMARRAYLYLVSGLAVVALMIALAFVIYQATRLLLGTDLIDDASWSLAVLIVASAVLAYHLYVLRSDVLVARVTEAPVATAVEVAQAVETIEIRGPVGADFTVLNAAIRSELPEDFELRVIQPGT